MKRYFVDAGLPETQIGYISTSTLIVGGGAVSDAPSAPSSASNVRAFYSKIHRAVGGVPVVGSFAWARFNADDETVSEELYWPPLSLVLIDDAVKLTQSLSSLGLTLKTPRVVIVHTPPSWEGPFAALASIDGEDEGGTTRHYDVNGKEFRLPHEERTINAAVR